MMFIQTNTLFTQFAEKPDKGLHVFRCFEGGSHCTGI